MSTQTPSTRESILVSLQNDEERFNTLINQRSAEDLQRPITPEGWSAKDFLAHMTHWKLATHALLVAYLHDQPLPEVVPDGDEANAIQRQQDLDRPLDEVQDDWLRVHTYLRHLLVDELDDTRLPERVRAPWPAEEPQSIRSLLVETCEHDDEHFTLIETYLH